MNNKHFNPMQEIWRTVKFYAFWLSLIAVIIILCARCTTSKDVSKSSTSFSQTKNLNTDSLARAVADSVNKSIDEKRKQDSLTVEFHINNEVELVDALNQAQELLYNKEVSIDSIARFLKHIQDSLRLNPCNNKARWNADGSFEISGAISKINRNLIDMSKKIDSTAVKKESETKVSKDQNESTELKSVTKEVVKTVTWFPWWIVVLIALAGMISGRWFGNKIPFIKTIKPKR